MVVFIEKCRKLVNSPKGNEKHFSKLSIENITKKCFSGIAEVEVVKDVTEGVNINLEEARSGKVVGNTVGEHDKVDNFVEEEAPEKLFDSGSNVDELLGWRAYALDINRKESLMISIFL